jgi:hypothetical protein
MRHTDLDRKCPCHGDLIELTDQPIPTIPFSACLQCFIEFRYKPDSGRVTDIYPGMRKSMDWPS